MRARVPSIVATKVENVTTRQQCHTNDKALWVTQARVRV